MVDYVRINIVRFVITIITVFVLLIGYYKLQFPFWSRQPVFHLHNIYYWTFPPGIITEKLPIKGRFFDDAIQYNNFYNIDKETLTNFVDFIKNNYSPKPIEKYEPTYESIVDCFKGQPGVPALTLKIYDGKILSSMTSRELECKIETNKLKINYVDFLCVHEKHRRKMYAGEQIWTHYYYTCHNRGNLISFFKRENKKTWIVPFSTYFNYIFKTNNWTPCFDFEQSNINIIYIDKSNQNKFYQLFMESREKFNYYITMNLGHIFYLINSGHIKVMVLMLNTTFMGYYVFRNPYTTYDGLQSLECITSYKNDMVDNNVFVLGFMIAMSLVSKDYKSEILLIENVANNNIIINMLLEKYSYLDRCVNSLYFYNFAYYPKDSNEILTFF